MNSTLLRDRLHSDIARLLNLLLSNAMLEFFEIDLNMSSIYLWSVSCGVRSKNGITHDESSHPPCRLDNIIGYGGRC
jgi:hypothetical protein